MMTTKQTWLSLGLSLCLGFGSISCGGGGSSSSTTTDGGGGGTDQDVTGLRIARQMSLVSSVDESTQSRSSFSKISSRINSLITPTSGDFLTDEADIWVKDRSMDFLDMINTVLCYTSSTHYDEFVNAGTYIAMVNVDECESDRSGDASNQSSATAVSLEKWIVNATRESNDAPQVVQFWVDNLDTTGTMIKAQITITEGKSDDNPFGVFRMDATEVDEEGNTFFTFALETSLTDVGDIDVQLSMNGEEEHDGQSAIFSKVAHANFLAGFNNQRGVAHIDGEMTSDFGNGSSTTDIAFNEEHYLSVIEENGEEDTFCMDRQGFENNVMSYNLYDSTSGDRIDLNAGQGVRFDNDGRTEYGWSNTWGVWFPPHVTVEDGMEVTNGDGTETFTVFKASGRTVQHVKETIALSELTEKNFNFWDQNSGSNFVVQWNGTDLVKVAEESCNENGCNRTDIDPTPLELSPNQWIGLYAQDFGFANIVVPEEGLSDEYLVTYYTDDQVLPNSDVFADGELTLYCYQQCPRPGITGAEWDSNNITFENSDNVEEPYIYTLSSDDLTLRYEGEPVGLADGETASEGGSNAWGFHSGNMLLAADAENMTNVWDMYNQDSTFTVEIGSNNWNNTIFLVDANGAPVVYDDPLRCDLDSDDFGRAMLQYEGAGKLHGIPWEQEESNDGDYSSWRPAYSLPDGTELNCDGTTYVTRGMAIEQRMVETDQGDCADLITGNIGEASIEYIADNTNIGDLPSVTDAPKVIDNVIQE